MPEKLLPRLREQHALSRAIDQTRADVLLQRLDRVADRRLREEQVLGRKREAAPPREGGEGEQLPTIENGLHG